MKWSFIWVVAFVVGLTLMLTSCSKTEIVDILQGKPGTNGTNGTNGADGANGHSLVSQYTEASGCECETSGQRMDVYLDVDDSLSVTEGDLYQGSLVACNGYNGLNGKDGLDGTDGAQGIPGEPGPQGEAGQVGPQGEAGQVGPQGEQGIPGPVGPQGPQGIQGLPGATGAQGPAGSGAVIQGSTSTCTLVVGNYYLKNNVLYDEDDSNKCDGNNDKVSFNMSGDSLWLTSTILAVKDGEGVIKVIKFN
jgi:Collagen triple helix repeat (20 copies)